MPRAPDVRTAGRPRSEWLMRLACRMCPLGKGKCGLALKGVRPPEPGEVISLAGAPLLLQAMREGCGLDSSFAKLSDRNQPLGGTPRSGSPRFSRGAAARRQPSPKGPTPVCRTGGVLPEACEIRGTRNSAPWEPLGVWGGLFSPPFWLPGTVVDGFCRSVT